MNSELTPEQAREKIYSGVCRDCGGELYHTRGGFNQDNCDNCHAAWTRDRREALDELVGKAMAEMTNESVYWTLPIEDGNAIQSPEPAWWELRESICRVLFELEREQIHFENEATRVVNECL